MINGEIVKLKDDKIIKINEDLIKLLEDYLVSHNLRKVELAKKLGTTPAGISRWLNRRHKIGRAWGLLIQQKLTE